MHHSTSSGRRGVLLAVVAALAAAFLTALPGTQALASAPDVYIRDNASDTGVEPSTGEIWHSPDIVVCATDSQCQSDVVISPSQTYYVFVTLTKDGPGSIFGQLHLYHTKAGGDASWSAGWQLFSVISTNVTATTTTLKATWTVPPEQDHYCLLARWVADEDLMNIEGPSTNDNTRYNNNIAWHNVKESLGSANADLPLDFMVGNPLPVDVQAGLTVAPDGAPFVGPGSILVDLGATLFQRWRAAGGHATGLRQVGTTRFQVVDPKLARFTGLLLRAGERLPVGLTFNGTREASGRPVNVVQTDAQGRDRGGVQYRLTFR